GILLRDDSESRAILTIHSYRRSGHSDLITDDSCESTGWCLRICSSPLESHDMLAST
ncbi:5250_t:CDS:2, partial [Scutellospora calospora]